MERSASGKEAVLEIDRLVVGVGGQPLVYLPELQVRRGQLLAVHGTSGRGKTTLLRTVAGLIDPLEGQVRLLGRTGDQHGWPHFRRQMPLVPQQPVLSEESVESNLARPLRFGGAGGRPFPRKRAVDLLRRLGLMDAILSQNAPSLSVGQQQRISLVRALLLEPPLVLLDEPTSALDEETAARTGSLLRELAQAGLATVIATHQTAFARSWCDRVLDLNVLAHTSEKSGDA